MHDNPGITDRRMERKKKIKKNSFSVLSQLQKRNWANKSLLWQINGINYERWIVSRKTTICWNYERRPERSFVLIRASPDVTSRLHDWILLTLEFLHSFRKAKWCHDLFWTRVISSQHRTPHHTTVGGWQCFQPAIVPRVILSRAMMLCIGTGTARSAEPSA